MQDFEGHLMFEPVRFDQVPYTWKFRAASWKEAFAEIDRVKARYTANGRPSWSHGVKGPWLR